MITSSLIESTEFERVTKKAQEKHEKVKSGPLEIKVKAHDIKALVDEKKETKLREQEELLNKTNDEYCKEFERKMEVLSPFKDEKVVKPSKKKKVTNKRKDLEE